MAGKRKRIYKKRDYIAFVFLAPWIIGFLVFQAYPFLSSAVYSFTDLSMLKEYKFIGLKNFQQIFTRDQNFVQSLKVTVIYVLVSVP